MPVRALVHTLLLALLAAGCRGSPPVECPQLACKVDCGDAGVREADDDGCPTCLCNHPPTSDAGWACPALTCPETCGLGYAADPLTGCPTCGCCHPADCQPGGRHGFSASGCPTCYACR